MVAEALVLEERKGCAKLPRHAVGFAEAPLVVGGNRRAE